MYRYVGTESRASYPETLSEYGERERRYQERERIAREEELEEQVRNLKRKAYKSYDDAIMRGFEKRQLPYDDEYISTFDSDNPETYEMFIERKMGGRGSIAERMEKEREKEMAEDEKREKRREKYSLSREEMPCENFYDRDPVTLEYFDDKETKYYVLNINGKNYCQTIDSLDGAIKYDYGGEYAYRKIIVGNGSNAYLIEPHFEKLVDIIESIPSSKYAKFILTSPVTVKMGTNQNEVYSNITYELVDKKVYLDFGMSSKKDRLLRNAIGKNDIQQFSKAIKSSDNMSNDTIELSLQFLVRNNKKFDKAFAVNTVKYLLEKTTVVPEQKKEILKYTKMIWE